jgi:glycosidase
MDVFGTMEDIEELIECVHQRQMRIILDLVMNHTSEYSSFFFLFILFLKRK